MTINVNGTLTVDNITDNELGILFKFKSENNGFGVIFSNMATLENGINNNIVLHWQNVDGLLKIANIIKLLNEIKSEKVIE